MRSLPLSLASTSSALLQSRPFGPLPRRRRKKVAVLWHCAIGGACGVGCFQYADRVECQWRSRLAASHDASIGDRCGASARAFAERLFEVRRADLAPQFADRPAILPRRPDAVTHPAPRSGGGLARVMARSERDEAIQLPAQNLLAIPAIPFRASAILFSSTPGLTRWSMLTRNESSDAANLVGRHAAWIAGPFDAKTALRACARQ
jgi:hypothetical protein